MAPTPRRPLLALAAIVGVAVLFLAFTVGVSRRPAPFVPVTADATFLSQANATCSAGLQAARGAIPTVTAASATPATIEAEANLVTAVADQLAAVPTTPAASPPILTWLSGWRAYSTDRLQLAAYLRAHPRPVTAASASRPADLPSTVRQLDRSAAAEASRADRFAAANGLDSCTLQPQASPALTPIP